MQEQPRPAPAQRLLATRSVVGLPPWERPNYIPSQLLPHVLPMVRCSPQSSPPAYSCLVTPSSPGSHRKPTRPQRPPQKTERQSRPLARLAEEFVSRTRSVGRNHLQGKPLETSAAFSAKSTGLKKGAGYIPNAERKKRPTSALSSKVVLQI